jgi:futalosine hydrolase
MKKIAVITATTTELSGLAKSLGITPSPVHAHEPYQAFPYGHQELTLCVSGIGTVNAAITATDLVHCFAPDVIVMTGCAGAYPASGLAIGDLALATSEIFADEGVLTPDGWHSLAWLDIPLFEKDGTRYFNEIPLAADPAQRTMVYAERTGINIKAGPFLTVSTCSGTTQRGAELQGRFGGLCENMEGAAVALVAARYGIDCLEIRGISNLVEDRNRSHWDIPLAMTAVNNVLVSLLKEL